MEDPEVKKVSTFATKIEEYSNLLDRLEYFSDWHRAKRAVAVIIRYQRRFKRSKINQQEQKNAESTDSQNAKKGKREDNNYVPANTSDILCAEREMMRLVQNEAFQDEVRILSSNNAHREPEDRKATKDHKKSMRQSSSLYRLDPFLDKEGLLRVGGRLRHASLPYEAKHPVIVPRKGHVTSMIIRHFHERTAHQGRGITHNEIKSSGFWIIGGSSTIAHHISKCVTCRKLRGTTEQQKMADLPSDRLEPAPPFTYAAVDYFGPWIIKEGRRELKRYGALFTCMSSRAIHIEVSNSLETDSFLNAYRRFVGRRGPVRQLRCDRGTNFIGARNELQAALEQMNHHKIHQELLKDNCDWVVFKTNVPHASHMGGVWERQIRSVRSVLATLLDRQGTQLDDESLRTFMVEAEAIVNSRPLTVESASSTDHPTPLTPSMLLTMKTKVLLPPPGVFQHADLYSRKRWRRVQYLANEFWLRWKKEFLQTLQQRPKWIPTNRNMKIDDIVIIKEESQPRNRWQLARVADTYPGDDGLVRK
ncbi:hypothetical protein QZH41_006839 [Actinostola sp. cb2023]|nr:hypothetical protein QZH41_006839 [Actinostola sp. cb2023]